MESQRPMKSTCCYVSDFEPCFEFFQFLWKFWYPWALCSSCSIWILKMVFKIDFVSSCRIDIPPKSALSNLQLYQCCGNTHLSCRSHYYPFWYWCYHFFYIFPVLNLVYNILQFNCNQESRCNKWVNIIAF